MLLKLLINLLNLDYIDNLISLCKVGSTILWKNFTYCIKKYLTLLSFKLRWIICCNIIETILKEDEPKEGRTKQNILSNCREYLANYQESCGTPRTEYSFAALIIVMAQATVRSLWAMIYVIVNIVPIIQVIIHKVSLYHTLTVRMRIEILKHKFQMFSFILRFVLDKIINIRRTKNIQRVLVKFAILAIQLLSVYVCLIFIFGFIVSPIIQMAVGIVAKFVMHA